MGLIKAALGSAGGVLADQWKDYFYCDSMPSDVLMTKGHKRNSGRSSSAYRRGDNRIYNGAVYNNAAANAGNRENGQTVRPGNSNSSSQPSMYRRSSTKNTRSSASTSTSSNREQYQNSNRSSSANGSYSRSSSANGSYSRSSSSNYNRSSSSSYGSGSSSTRSSSGSSSSSQSSGRSGGGSSYRR